MFVVSTLWALGRWRHRPGPAVMAGLMRGASARVLPSASPTDLSTLVWAAGRLGYLPDAPWLDAWLASSDAAMRAGRCGAPHYAAAALELGRWGVVPAAGWREVFYRSSESRWGSLVGR
jgi:hypothetical protein